PALSRPDDRLCENESMPVWIVFGVAAALFVLVFVVAATFNVFSAETADEAEERWNGLPEGFTGADLETVTFRPALRGYRMEDVDQAMERLRERLDELESAADVDLAESANAAAGANAAAPARAADADANDDAAPANDATGAASDAATSADAEGTSAGPRWADPLTCPESPSLPKSSTPPGSHAWAPCS